MGSIRGVPPQVYCMLEVWHFIGNVIVFIQIQRHCVKLKFDPVKLHVNQFFGVDVMLRLIYQN